MNTVAAFAGGELAGDVAEPSAPDEVGDLARMLQVFRDNVLARSAAEEALRRSEEQYRSVVDNAAEGIVIVQEQRIAFANPRVLAITGYAADAVVGHWFLEYVHPDDRERAMRGVPHDEDNATGDSRTQHVRLLARSGRWIVLEVKSVAIAWRGATATLNLFTDVTDRVRLEGELRRTLNEREKILENSIVGIVFLNAQGHLHWCNRATEQLYGIDRETWTGRSLEPLYPSRVEYERVGRAVSDAVRSGRSFETEIQMRRADGTPFWVLLAGKAIDSADFSAGTIWIVRDVSRRKQLEAELQRTSSEREAILNSTLVGITLSVDRVHRWVNQRFAEMLGYAPAELIGRSSRVHFPDEESYQALGRTAYPQIAASGSYTTECQMRRKDGELIWVELYGQAIDRADPGRGTIWTFVDVTTRKRLAEQLRATSSEREAILNNTLVGITFSVDRRRLWINRRFAEMTGFEPAELIGQSSRLHFPDEASYEAFGREAFAELAKSGTYSTELQVLRKDGTPIWLELHGSTSSPGELGKGVIWTAVDVTKRREAEESMRLALQQQTELSDLKSRFVSMASHEFRTPLATILSSAKLLRDYGERFASEERAELLQSIQSSVRRMTDLLDQVLVIGRAEAGRLAYAPAPLDLEACCRRLVREAEHLGGRADVTPSRVVFGFTGEDRVVELDEKLLHHILGNLLSNALKYTPGDDPVSLEVRSTPGESTFVVSDTGIGIPEKEMPHLFETFHRASNVGNIQGTGLGLAIVKRAVDLHGGTIGVMSAAGKGSRFEVRLPHRKGASANGQDSHHRG